MALPTTVCQTSFLYLGHPKCLCCGQAIRRSLAAASQHPGEIKQSWDSRRLSTGEREYQSFATYVCQCGTRGTNETVEHNAILQASRIRPSETWVDICNFLRPGSKNIVELMSPRKLWTYTLAEQYDLMHKKSTTRNQPQPSGSHDNNAGNRTDSATASSDEATKRKARISPK